MLPGISFSGRNDWKPALCRPATRAHAATLVYQDVHPEEPCPECGGAGFFGDGPVVDSCGYCMGTGVLIDEGILPAERKPATTQGPHLCWRHRLG